MQNKLSFARFKRGLNHLKRSNLYLKRFIELKADEKKAMKLIYINKKEVPRVFNLDLHIGVIADLEQELKKLKIELTRWSISMHNHLVPNRLPITDPVRYINARKWHLMDFDRILKFQERYKKFLNSFDGFICTYSPVFAELYNDLNKPIYIFDGGIRYIYNSDQYAQTDITKYVNPKLRNKYINIRYVFYTGDMIPDDMEILYFK